MAYSAVPVAEWEPREFAERFRRARERLGWSRAEAADVLGISSSQVLRYEKGASGVPLAVAVRLADALGLPLDTLVGRETPGPTVVLMIGERTVLVTPDGAVLPYHGDQPLTDRRQGMAADQLPHLRAAAAAAIAAAQAARPGGRRQVDAPPRDGRNRAVG
jgi:transcriptional regulator with XRE-family HTH domain